MISLLLTLACSTSTAPAPQTPAITPAIRAPASAELKAHMQGHLAAVNQVRDALVRGDLPAAKAANRDFLDHKVAFDLPGDWLRHLTAMGGAAVELDAASDVQAASLAAAKVVAACGGCHREVDGRVEIPVPANGEAHATAATHELQSMWVSLITLDRTSTERPAKAAALLASCSECHANTDAPSRTEPQPSDPAPGAENNPNADR